MSTANKLEINTLAYFAQALAIKEKYYVKVALII